MRKLRVPMYGPQLYIVWTESAQAGVEFLRTLYPDDDLGLEQCTNSRTEAFVMPIDEWPWMVLPYDASIDTIAHEAVHATHMYLAAVGVRTTPSNDEAMAYFMGWLVGRLVDQQADVALERAKRLHPGHAKPATPPKSRAKRAPVTPTPVSPPVPLAAVPDLTGDELPL